VIRSTFFIKILSEFLNFLINLIATPINSQMFRVRESKHNAASSNDTASVAH
jgi:hypothetical protein